ncbi:MAG: 2-C-methyl-D-erythritol 4-phosphate cytidylyltransferase [Bryobacteraceae bacterium]
MRVSVILPAAGLGTRMTRRGDAAANRKQFLPLDGVPVFLYTARKFVEHESVCEVVVAVRPEDIEWTEGVVDGAQLPKPVRVVEGGDARQGSVANALALVDPTVDLVAVHDAVRPFIDPETIDAVFAEAARSGGAIVGVVPVDTVKQVETRPANRIAIRATIPRDHLVLAQTPQVFHYSVLKRAFDAARADGFTGTDEASLVERLEEIEVSVVAGSDRNIKITKPSDLELARLFSQTMQERP